MTRTIKSNAASEACRKRIEAQEKQVAALGKDFPQMGAILLAMHERLKALELGRNAARELAKGP
jgi:hypothetical protein